MNTLFAIGTRCRVSSCVQIPEIDANSCAPGRESDRRPNHRSISQIRRATTILLSCALLPNYAPIDYAFAFVDLWVGRPRFAPAALKRSTGRQPTYVEWDTQYGPMTPDVHRRFRSTPRSRCIRGVFRARPNSCPCGSTAIPPTMPAGWRNTISKYRPLGGAVDRARRRQ